MKIDRVKVFEKYNGKCGYCGESILLKTMQVDHIIPQYNYLFHIKNQFKIPVFLNHLGESDMNHPDNLMPSCRVCNKWKGAFDLDLFRKEVFEQIKRLNDYSSNYRMAKRYNLVEENPKPVVFYFEKV